MTSPKISNKYTIILYVRRYQFIKSSSPWPLVLAYYHDDIVRNIPHYLPWLAGNPVPSSHLNAPSVVDVAAVIIYIRSISQGGEVLSLPASGMILLKSQSWDKAYWKPIQKSMVLAGLPTLFGQWWTSICYHVVAVNIVRHGYAKVWCCKWWKTRMWCYPKHSRRLLESFTQYQAWANIQCSYSLASRSRRYPRLRSISYHSMLLLTRYESES